MMILMFLVQINPSTSIACSMRQLTNGIKDRSNPCSITSPEMTFWVLNSETLPPGINSIGRKISKKLFLVKIAYQLALRLHSPSLGEHSLAHQDRSLWKKLWLLHTPPKVLNFLWRYWPNLDAQVEFGTFQKLGDLTTRRQVAVWYKRGNDYMITMEC